MPFSTRCGPDSQTKAGKRSDFIADALTSPDGREWR